jgi:hypothetical protein
MLNFIVQWDNNVKNVPVEPSLFKYFALQKIAPHDDAKVGRLLDDILTLTFRPRLHRNSAGHSHGQARQADRDTIRFVS